MNSGPQGFYSVQCEGSQCLSRFPVLLRGLYYLSETAVYFLRRGVDRDKRDVVVLDVGDM
jgi:hypothetical protein